ncbi:peptide chain release factor N(5)-glutamine methyltransferase [Thermodesulfobacteriota bacterium]
MQNKTWNIKDILAWTADYFVEKEIDSPRSTSELLLGKVLNLTRMKLYLNYDRPLSENELKEYKSYIKRCAGSEPVQYIVGNQEFWSLDFRVTPDVLIPRADTETLVEHVLEDIRNSSKDSISILEIGTGSGIISVSIAHELKNEMNISILALDISEGALNIAKENANKNGVDDIVEFALSDKFSSVKPDDKFDYILSNPPYIAKEYYDQLDKKVKEFEPKLALYCGEDGLSFYKDIFDSAHDYLNDDGKIIVEIDFRKRDELSHLIDKLKYSNINFLKDLSGHDRVLSLTKRG